MENEIKDEKGTFRDELSTVDKDGNRNWIYPKKPFGRLFDLRKYVSYILLAILFFVPFIKVNGEPLFLFNVLEGKFIIFGQIFWPQDAHLFGLGFVLFIVFIVVFTTIFGRVWCGWLCPQTIFMEMVFRRIEYAIEGDANKQRKLDKQPWNAEKLRKKGLKYIIFFILSWLIAHMVVAWIIGVDRMKELLITNPSENWITFVVMMILTFLVFAIYIRFREQMCTTFCPYGRLQGVMLGKDSLVVAYDYERGEPRGKKSDPTAGDCIDCKACVNVCPTGIDIRNGTQLECVNCTACIDACDDIMVKLDRPINLIGFLTEENIESREKFNFSLRQKAYFVAMGLIITVMAILLMQRTDVEATILRNAGFTFNIEENGDITNMYKINLVNKTNETMFFSIQSDLKDAKLQIIGNNKNMMQVEKGELYNGMMLITVPKSSLNGSQTPLNFSVVNKDNKILDELDSSFLGPQE